MHSSQHRQRSIRNLTSLFGIGLFYFVLIAPLAIQAQQPGYLYVEFTREQLEPLLPVTLDESFYLQLRVGRTEAAVEATSESASVGQGNFLDGFVKTTEPDGRGTVWVSRPIPFLEGQFHGGWQRVGTFVESSYWAGISLYRRASASEPACLFEAEPFRLFLRPTWTIGRGGFDELKMFRDCVPCDEVLCIDLNEVSPKLEVIHTENGIELSWPGGRLMEADRLTDRFWPTDLTNQEHAPSLRYHPPAGSSQRFYRIVPVLQPEVTTRQDYFRNPPFNRTLESWFTRVLTWMGEPSFIIEDPETNNREVYRFLNLRSFSANSLIRVERVGNRYLLKTALIGGEGGPDKERLISQDYTWLSSTETEEFLEDWNASDFWDIGPDTAPPVPDGIRIMIEASVGPQHHAVTRAGSAGLSHLRAIIARFDPF